MAKLISGGKDHATCICLMFVDDNWKKEEQSDLWGLASERKQCFFLKIFPSDLNIQSAASSVKHEIEKSLFSREELVTHTQFSWSSLISILSKKQRLRADGEVL